MRHSEADYSCENPVVSEAEEKDVDPRQEFASLPRPWNGYDS